MPPSCALWTGRLGDGLLARMVLGLRFVVRIFFALLDHLNLLSEYAPMTTLADEIERARIETDRLSRELDITNADHIALWLEANMEDSTISWLACRIVEAHEWATNRKHRYWGAGEPDCPREIKAGNGELHTLRCKVCGQDNPRDQICRAMPLEDRT